MTTKPKKESEFFTLMPVKRPRKGKTALKIKFRGGDLLLAEEGSSNFPTMEKDLINLLISDLQLLLERVKND